jgi:hypothetical protein
MEDLAGVGKALEAVGELTKEGRELFLRLCGPSADELGQHFADHIRWWRSKRALARFKEAEALCSKSGLRIIESPDMRVMVPLLEKCSLVEDDDEMSRRWARLLATTMTSGGVHPAYPQILAEVTAVEAQILEFLFDRAVAWLARRAGDEERYAEAIRKGWARLSITSERQLQQQFKLEAFELRVALDNLVRLRLVFDKDPKHPDHVFLTAQAFQFMRACRGPEFP